MTYIVYGKPPEHKRFKAVGRNGLVSKLIHAIMFTDEIEAQKDCDSLTAANKDWIFEVRKFK